MKPFAFAQAEHVGSIGRSVGGLTKREYFSAAAMQGFAAATGDAYSSVTIAFCSVNLADAVLALLEKNDEGKSNV